MPDDFDLLVLGDINPDLVLTGEDLIPAFGQVEQLLDGAALTIGGSGAIVACGAARLGLRTAIVGVVGDDLFGRFMLGALSERGVDVSGVATVAGLSTGLTVVLARPDDRGMLTFPGTCAALTAEAVPRALLRGSRHVHVSSFFLQTRLAPSLPALFGEVRAAGATTSLDPNWDPAERWDSGLGEVLKVADVFLPNAQEAQRIAGVSETIEAAAALATHGALVAVKLGAQGALASFPESESEREPVTVSPSFDIVPVDTVGAGDSFDAGLLAGILRGETTQRALALGCACGALSTQAAGGTAAQPTLPEALQALDGQPSA